MSDKTRLLATLIIWTAFTAIFGIIGGIMIVSHADLDFGGAIVLLVIVLALMAVVGSSTQAVWGVRDSDQTDDNEQQAKAKRTGRSRVERLIEALDDDEIYDLESLLRSREDSISRRKE